LLFAYLLLLLIPVLAVGYIVWDYRRKIAERDAVSAERLHDVIGVATHTQRADSPQPEAGALARSAPKNTAPMVSYVLRERLLTPPQTLLYYLLRTTLPDHVVFAQMTLASVLETAAGVADHARHEMARRLADHTYDFVISDRRMRPVVVLKLTATDDGTGHELSSAQRWLAEAGVRYVELDARSLPRKDAIRAVVLGDPVAVQGTEITAATSG
jgi:hypothetical protein